MVAWGDTLLPANVWPCHVCCDGVGCYNYGEEKEEAKADIGYSKGQQKAMHQSQ